MKNQELWHLLKSYHYVELWKTPSRFLVCYKYKGIFKFVNSFQEGIEMMKNIYDQLEAKRM